MVKTALSHALTETDKESSKKRSKLKRQMLSVNNILTQNKKQGGRI